MALNYFKSKDVRVFPSSFRGTFNETISFDPESRLNTEANFIAPKISGNKASYIVDYTKTEEVITSIKFVLGGYYFEIKNLNSYSLNDSYLHIKLRNIKIADNQQADNKDSERITTVLGPWGTNTDNILDYLDTENKISYFTGLKISEENADSNAAASIKLLDADGNINQEAILVDLDHGKGENTLLHGVGLKANSENQTVFGTYNDNKTTTLFEIGKGSANDTRANALEISTTTTVVNNPTININGETITVDGDTLINLKGATKIDGTTNIWGNLGIHDEDQSNSTTTGAVVISGGVGIGKNLNVGGDTNLNDKLIVKTSPTDDETNVEIDGTLNITDDTTIASNITITSTETTLTKPLEITDTTANALKVSGDVTLSKDLSVGATDSEVLVVKASPESGKANVEIAGTLSSSDKATFKNGLEVASGKTTTLGGQVNITGAVNINTTNQTNPEAITIYGDTSIIGAVTITGKATSTATAKTDGSTTLTTKGYVDSKITDLKADSVGAAGSYLQTISEANGIITATTQTFDTTISSSSTDNNAPTSQAVKNYVGVQVDTLNTTITNTIKGIWDTDSIKDPGNEHNTKSLKNILLDICYPIGSVYIMHSEDLLTTCPIQNNLGGTWTLIEAGRFLVAANNDVNGLYYSRKTGGSADAIVVAHKHSYEGTVTKTEAAGAHTHTVTHKASKTGIDEYTGFEGNAGDKWKQKVKAEVSTDGEHTHKITLPEVAAAGYDGTNKNLPPYVAVYMWRRTA